MPQICVPLTVCTWHTLCAQFTLCNTNLLAAVGIGLAGESQVGTHWAPGVAVDMAELYPGMLLQWIHSPRAHHAALSTESYLIY